MRVETLGVTTTGTELRLCLVEDDGRERLSPLPRGGLGRFTGRDAEMSLEFSISNTEL